MVRTKIAKGIILAAECVCFVFLLRGDLAAAGIGFIVTGILAAVFGLCGADVIILGGAELLFIKYDQKFLFFVTNILLLAVAAYDGIILYRSVKQGGEHSDKDNRLKLFRQKQLLNILVDKLKKQK